MSRGGRPPLSGGLLYVSPYLVASYLLVCMRIAQGPSGLNDDRRVRSDALDESPDRSAIDRDAALRRAETRPGGMQEDGRAAPAHGRMPVPVEVEHQVVEVIIAPYPLMACRIGQPHGAVIKPVARRIAPAVIRPQDGEVKACCGAADAVGTVERAKHAMAADRGTAIAFALVVNRPGTAESTAENKRPGNQPAALRVCRRAKDADNPDRAAFHEA
jgi:hypothetical protein